MGTELDAYMHSVLLCTKNALVKNELKLTLYLAARVSERGNYASLESLVHLTLNITWRETATSGKSDDPAPCCSNTPEPRSDPPCVKQSKIIPDRSVGDTQPFAKRRKMTSDRPAEVDELLANRPDMTNVTPLKDGYYSSSVASIDVNTCDDGHQYVLAILITSDLEFLTLENISLIPTEDHSATGCFRLAGMESERVRICPHGDEKLILKGIDEDKILKLDRSSST